MISTARSSLMNYYENVIFDSTDSKLTPDEFEAAYPFVLTYKEGDAIGEATVLGTEHFTVANASVMQLMRLTGDRLHIAMIARFNVPPPSELELAEREFRKLNAAIPIMKEYLLPDAKLINPTTFALLIPGTQEHAEFVTLTQQRLDVAIARLAEITEQYPYIQ